MRSNFKVLLATSILVLTAPACQALGSGEDTPPFPDSESSDSVILNDDFSAIRWGTGTDADSAVEYVDNTLNFIVYTNNYFVWSRPDDKTYSDVHMEVTVINHDTDSTTAFGLICNKFTDSDFYYGAMTPAGQYAIAKAATEETDLFLTNNDEWADSDRIAVNAPSYRVGMDCGNGRLALYVDGVEIASVTDSTYTSGRVAVFTWSGEETGLNTNLSFDDFAMTKLP